MKQAFKFLVFLTGLLCALVAGAGASGPGCGTTFSEPITKAEVLEFIKDGKDYKGKDFKALVFSGTALNSGGDRQVTFRVSQLWKGKPQRYITLPPDPNDFRYPFQLGHKYLVYAHQYAGYITANECTPTKALSEANADLSILGPPIYEPNPLPLLLSAIGATLAVGIGGFYWRHKMKLKL
jgi:hypothetical protein